MSLSKHGVRLKASGVTKDILRARAMFLYPEDGAKVQRPTTDPFVAGRINANSVSQAAIGFLERGGGEGLATDASGSDESARGEAEGDGALDTGTWNAGEALDPNGETHDAATEAPETDAETFDMGDDRDSRPTRRRKLFRGSPTPPLEEPHQGLQTGTHLNDSLENASDIVTFNTVVQAMDRLVIWARDEMGMHPRGVAAGIRLGMNDHYERAVRRDPTFAQRWEDLLRSQGRIPGAAAQGHRQPEANEEQRASGERLMAVAKAGDADDVEDGDDLKEEDEDEDVDEETEGPPS
jgi:hypothetical protein